MEGNNANESSIDPVNDSTHRRKGDGFTALRSLAAEGKQGIAQLSGIRELHRLPEGIEGHQQLFAALLPLVGQRLLGLALADEGDAAPGSAGPGGPGAGRSAVLPDSAENPGRAAALPP